LIWLLFALVIVAVYFFALDLPLLGPDEPRYAQVAREMFERNDWVTPTLGGANWFEKPALLYWLQIAAYKLFGVSEFAARFGSALFGLGTIFSLWILGKSLAAENTEKRGEIENKKILSPFSVNSVAKKDFGNWLALIAASSIGLIAFSRGASFDIILTFPLTAALVAFFISDQSKNKSSFTFYFSLFTFYFFIGAAMLAKGLIGIVFPSAIVAFIFCFPEKLPSKIFIFSLFWGTVLLYCRFGWYLPMYRRTAGGSLTNFFIQHHFQRYTSNKYQHPQPFYFFLWVLPLMTLPWLPFFAAAIWDFFKSKIQSPNSKVQTQSKSPRLLFSASPLLLFSLSWLLVPLVFFSFSGSKLPGYILPALPAALVLTAKYVWHFRQKSQKKKYAVQFVAFAMFAVAAVALRFVVPAYAAADTTKYLIETADANGYRDAKILNLHTISHNAEFYGAGRLIRDADGKLKKHFGVSEVAEEIKRQGGKTVLVLVTLEYLHELPESNLVESKILGESGELAIVAVGMPSS
jgi:4-amino-4-deoxy-L-arabinose transferase-like glycosyltransferase